jgi:hypothetical protein
MLLSRESRGRCVGDLVVVWYVRRGLGGGAAEVEAGLGGWAGRPRPRIPCGGRTGERTHVGVVKA